MRTLRRLVFLVVIGLAVAKGAVALVTQRWSSGQPPPARKLNGDERWVTTDDGAELRVVELGEGPLVVLAHGIGGRLDHWSPIAERVAAAGFRVVTFDQRGHHKSKLGTRPFSPEALGADLLAVIASCGTTASVVVGHSMGGIGIQGAMSHGLAEATDSVVLVSTLEGPASEVGLSPKAAAAFIKLAQNETAGRLVMRGGFGKSVHLDDLEEIRLAWAAMDPTAFGIAADGLKNFDFTDELRNCELNVHVVCGTSDRVTPIARSRRIHDLLTNSTLVELPGIGHMSTWEAADTIVEQILKATDAA